ncbi:hypothetical protein KAU15_07065, partial [candidate division WOR-3 bacterium]|nr:hypothetical protein [candidate division WOR-3 bacterium]
MSRLKTFSIGGIHPSDRKELTEEKKLERMPVPEILHIPVNQ